MTDILALVKRLREARAAYYNSSPIMSDSVFDSLEDELRRLAPSHPYFDEVGAPLLNAMDFLMGAPVVPVAAKPAPLPAPKAPTPQIISVFIPQGPQSQWQKATHKAPMGSLNKAQTTAELLDWWKGGTVGGMFAQMMCISDKCDGISISLRYQNGKLVQAITRGDGSVGEDITPNVIKMQGIKKAIADFSGHLRGEIVILHEDMERYFEDYSNPRNAASGVAKRLDGESSEHLTVLHYQALPDAGCSVTPFKSKLKEFQWLQKIGCKVPRFSVAVSTKEVETLYQQYIDKERKVLGYDIDGLVIEFDSLDHQSGLGEVNNRPRGATALKFPHETAKSILHNVRWQVGNSGRVTPVAEFDPVLLAGAQVKQASLYNISYMEELVREAKGIGTYPRQGDTILGSRRNDVIPCVEAILLQNTGTYTEFAPPATCPVCGTSLIRDGEFLVCPNTDECPAQKSGAVRRWVVKIGLKDWGPAIIDALVEAGMVNDIADLYKVSWRTMATVQLSGRKLGETTAEKLFDILHMHKFLPLHTFIGSLGIPMCARSVAKMIVDAGYDTIDKMQSASVHEIAAIPGLGQAKAQFFVTGMAKRKDLIQKLLNAGINVKAPATGALKGKKVCFTGFRDADMEATIEEMGGTIKTSCTKDLDILVAVEPDSTSGKAQKARSQGTKILGVDEMKKLLGM